MKVSIGEFAETLHRLVPESRSRMRIPERRHERLVAGDLLEDFIRSEVAVQWSPGKRSCYSPTECGK